MEKSSKPDLIDVHFQREVGWMPYTGALTYEKDTEKYRGTGICSCCGSIRAGKGAYYRMDTSATGIKNAKGIYFSYDLDVEGIIKEALDQQDKEKLESFTLKDEDGQTLSFVWRPE